MFEVIFSKRANETFDLIQTQLLTRWGTGIVIKFEQRTWKIIKSISNTPYIYQSIKTNVEVRKAVIHKNCSLFYKIREKRVVILFFWDNRQEPIL
jgi:plasmid stabilization system protein ParE